jgi:hypothetical protein
MPWEPDTVYNERHAQHRQRQWWGRLKGIVRTYRRRVAMLGVLILSSLLLACPLSMLAIHYAILTPPCYMHIVGNPFVEPTYYVSAGLPPDPSTYHVEIGHSRPVVEGGFNSESILAISIPLTQPIDCRQSVANSPTR